jgi:undecaprenyl-diphosphatase
VDEYLAAILLGALQAITEFLPISSSGHLLLAEALFGGDTASPTFDVGLHLGTLLAVLVYFRADWLGFARSLAADVGGPGLDLRRWGLQSRLLLAIALATVPAVIAGFTLNTAIEAYLRAPVVVGVNLIAFGLLLAWADGLPASRRLATMSYAQALLVGVAQAIALMPGVSRSGATMTAARALSFDRDAAARFSFLMSAPVVFAAATLELGSALVTAEPLAWGPMLAGAVAAGIVGWLVIAGLLAYLRTRTMRVFAWYRIALGLVVLAGVALDVF